MIAHITIILSFQALLKAYSPHKFLHRGRKKSLWESILFRKKIQKQTKGPVLLEPVPLMDTYMDLF